MSQTSDLIFPDPVVYPNFNIYPPKAGSHAISTQIIPKTIIVTKNDACELSPKLHM